MLTLPSLPNTITRLLNTDYERLTGQGRYVPQGSQQCITCGGAKKFRWWSPEGEPAEYECSCKDQNRAHAFFLNSGVELQYQRLTWTDATGVPQSVIAQISDYASKIDYHIHAGTNLVLWSPTRGTGKTMLANLLLKELLVLGVDGQFSRFTDLMDDMTATYGDSGDAKAWFHRRIRNTRVLVIDDIGQERKVVKMSRDGDGNKVAEMRTSDYAGRLLEEVVRVRDAAEMPTIITTNMTPDVLYAYHDGVMSLLARNTIEIEVTGSDYRKSDERKQRLQVQHEQQMKAPVVW